MRTKPFTVYPSCFTLKKGESINLNIQFLPLSLGNHIKEFYMLCDNNQVRLFSLKGLSRQIDISIIEINNTRYNNKNNNNNNDKKNVNKYNDCDLYFSNVTVQTEKIQQLIICNDTGISIEYEWIWLPVNILQENIRKIAEEILR